MGLMRLAAFDYMTTDEAEAEFHTIFGTAARRTSIIVPNYHNEETERRTWFGSSANPHSVDFGDIRPTDQTTGIVYFGFRMYSLYAPTAVGIANLSSYSPPSTTRVSVPNDLNSYIEVLLDLDNDTIEIYLNGRREIYTSLETIGFLPDDPIHVIAGNLTTSTSTTYRNSYTYYNDIYMHYAPPGDSFRRLGDARVHAIQSTLAAGVGWESTGSGGEMSTEQTEAPLIASGLTPRSETAVINEIRGISLYGNSHDQNNLDTFNVEYGLSYQGNALFNGTFPMQGSATKELLYMEKVSGWTVTNLGDVQLEVTVHER